MELQEVWTEVKPHVKAMASVVAEKVIMASLDKVVADSENKIDDAFLAVVKPVIMDELKKQIEQI